METGQATPQSPVGGLFRSKRAVFVGDPLQVQPVVQVEAKLSDVLLKKIIYLICGIAVLSQLNKSQTETIRMEQLLGMAKVLYGWVLL